MQGVVEQLYQYGYLIPGAYETLNVYDVEDAIQRYRDFLGLPDISIGDLFSLERCGVEDISPDQTGSGSWPSGCHEEYPNNHSFAVHFDLAGMPSHWKPAFEQAWTLVKQAYADVGIVFFETKNKSKANTLVTFQKGAGWIGLAIVPRGPKCGQRIWAKFDNRYGSNFSLERLINQLAHLMAHEFGHNMGLGHTRGGIMNPTLLNTPFTPTAWRGTPSFSTVARWFSGIPVTTDPIWTIPQPEQP